MAAASVLALSACGGSAELAAGGAEPDSVGGTRVVVDVEGTEVEVPEAPRRVVTLSEPTLDGVLALGLEPIGTVTGRGQATVPAYLQDVAGDLPVLGSVAQPNFEAIGAAGPDLILVDGTSVNNNPDVIAALREIAPVVYTGYAGGDWRLNFGLTAEALGKEDQAEEIIADYDERAAAIAAELEPEYGDKTFSIVRWQGGGAATILQELPPGAALEDLGLARPPSQDMRGRGHSNPVSLENLEEIDADYMFFGTLGGSSVDNPQAGGSADVEEAESALQTAVETPGFSQLKAYQEGNIIPVDGSAWTSTGGPLLMTRIIEDVREELLR
ncbi:iron-siderophore ABC transporter substrate-binding protein [Nesterenkonia muleiensis]|uniref:ABC transporter substrate-binding protein n=1 Tax=Nesterenkonia muleiensis TaxID=2282648 RepID=UPI00192E42B5|nr:iron-siderophore ABC transporter substrate-binding protein [Nesterenkonia muleiensis]